MSYGWQRSEKAIVNVFLKIISAQTILSNTIDIKDEENFQLFPRHWHKCCPSQSVGSSWEEVKGWDPPKLAEDPWTIRYPFVSGSEKIEHSWSMLTVGFPFFGPCHVTSLLVQFSVSSTLVLHCGPGSQREWLEQVMFGVFPEAQATREHSQQTRSFLNSKCSHYVTLVRFKIWGPPKRHFSHIAQQGNDG